MNIALIGYGKMGKAIEAVAVARGHKVVLIVDVNNVHECVPARLQKADVAIEFTTPDTAVGNLKACFDAQVPVVCGTTGWLDQLDAVQQHCANKGGGLFYTSNYSIGVQIFFDINKRLAELVNRYRSDYRATLEEVHHTTKKDAPSGTAISRTNIQFSIRNISYQINSFLIL
ncbi:hypothetical protein AGMMS4956_13940 [Bacteroidia bacterium]|nr:hypothetical protein AGMMS4956_13940 [Bacteroidia bacterium]